MATIVGNDGVVKSGSNAVAEVTSFSISQSAGTVETTAMGDAWVSRSAIQKSFSGSVSCHYDPSDTTGQNTFTVGSSVTLNLQPEGDTTGDTLLTGTAIITSLDIEQSLDGIVGVSFSFEGDGALTTTTVS